MLTGTRKGSLQNLSSCHLRAQRTVRPAAGTSAWSLRGRLSITLIMHCTCLLLASTHPLCRTAWITSLRSDLFMGAQVSSRQPCAINKFRSPRIPRKTWTVPALCLQRGWPNICSAQLLESRFPSGSEVLAAASTSQTAERALCKSALKKWVSHYKRRPEVCDVWPPFSLNLEGSEAALCSSLRLSPSLWTWRERSGSSACNNNVSVWGASTL